MEPTIQKQKKYSIRFASIGVVVLGIGYALHVLVAPPQNFPAPYTLSIESGQTLFSISAELAGDNVIRSPRIFEMLMLTVGSDKTISEGQYVFDRPMSALAIALRISTRYYGVEKVRITFPEGFTRAQMIQRVGELFSETTAKEFAAYSEGKEGYLFPDTYSFFPQVSGQEIAKRLMDTFSQKMVSLKGIIEATEYTQEQIVTMASLVEKEARGEDDRAMIAGILWKRLELGMPLQVDATIRYITTKDTESLSTKDFKIDSPYNTYLYKGLPPAPIANPGLLALKATTSPKQSSYLYYLHEKSGRIHYATTYAEHQANIARYLK